MKVPMPQLDRTQLLKGVLDGVVLAALAHEDGYGYVVVRRLRDAGLDDLGDASVYGTLRRLFAQGLLKSYVLPSDEGPHRKFYGLTPLGHKTLASHTGSWMNFSSIVGTILNGDAFTTSPGDDQ